MIRVTVHTVGLTVPFEFNVPDDFQTNVSVRPLVRFDSVDGVAHVFNRDQIVCIKYRTVEAP